MVVECGGVVADKVEAGLGVGFGAKGDPSLGFGVGTRLEEVTDVVDANTAVDDAGAVTVAVLDHVVPKVISRRFALAIIIAETRSESVVMSP